SYCPMSSLFALSKLMRSAFGVFLDILTFLQLILRSPMALAAENLFLRKQLALYVERKQKPRRASDAVRFTMAQLSRFFEWRDPKGPAETSRRWMTFVRNHVEAIVADDCCIVVTATFRLVYVLVIMINVTD